PKRFLNILLSLGISLILLGLLLSGISDSTELAFRPRLVALLSNTSLLCIGLYVLTSFSQTFFRALRYQLILQHAQGEELPGFFHLFIVTMSRNMFVDMLPARLGELSYLAMLNRGFKVGADACLASLALSFVFDLIALACMLLGIMGFQLLCADFQPWLISIFVLILGISGGILACFFPVLQGLNRWLVTFSPSNPWLANTMSTITALLADIATSLMQARQARMVGRLLALSLCVRIFKYLGLYLLFLGVVQSFPDINREISSVLMALISAEAGSALPIPSFMSFGTYEAGGALALIVLGAAKTTSVLVMLALHIWSQVVDYGLGIGAMILFIFALGKGDASDAVAPRGSKKFNKKCFTRYTGHRRGGSLYSSLHTKQKKWLFIAGILLALGLFVFAFQVREIKKMGSFRPPKPGEPVSAVLAQQKNPLLSQLRGMVIWSTNRFGNHDLVMLTLPEQQLTRLTSDSHTEYFPRISPDGTKVVYCRSQEPWVSQRNPYPWDTWLLDLPSGKSRLLAK
ncbi:MAG: hypothetical protein D3923_14580, partial [Candidatus Electrothrix sp. AR3]|nr:hypothetical protein [Candidatus Electrothrix sp. AR3]